MATIQKLEELEIWQLARTLNISINSICTQNNISKDYRFISQFSASAGSIMDNIAEGFERHGNKEFIQFLMIAKASAGELKSQLYRLFDVDKIPSELFYQLISLIESISRKIAALIKYLETSPLKGRRYRN
jgi:four helix bundle protein